MVLKKKKVQKKRPVFHRVLFYSVFLMICSVVVYYRFVDQITEVPGTVGNLKKINFNLRWSGNRSAGMNPDDFVKMIKRAMKVKPDTRLLNGLINLQYAMKPSKEDWLYEIKNEDEGWSLVKDGKVLHIIPNGFGPKEYFERAKTVLPELAANSNFKLVRKDPSNELKELKVAIDSFAYPLIIPALGRLNELHESSPDNLEIYRLITKGTIILSMYTSAYFVDDVSLESKALSLFTVLKYFSKEGIEEEEALIAVMLGYPDYIKEAIARLPQKGGFAFILPLDSQKFEEYIHEMKRPLRDVFLYLQILSLREGADSILEREVEKLLETYGESILPAASKMALKRFTFNLGNRLAHLHTEYAVRTMDGQIDWFEDPQLFLDDLKLRFKMDGIKFFPHLYSKAEHILKRNSSKYKGKIFGQSEYERFYHCILYDMLAKMGNQPLKVQANKGQTESFIRSLDDFPGDYAKLYKKYLLASAEAIFSKPNGYYKLDELVKYLDTAAFRLFDLFDLLNRNFGTTNPHLPMAAVLMNLKLDDRPEFYRYVSNLHHTLLFNPENSYRSLVRLHQHDPDGQVENGYWLRFMDSGELDIQELFMDVNLNFERKYYIVRQLLKKEMPLEEWKTLVKQKMERNKQDKYALMDYVDALYSEKKLEEARDILLRHAPYFESSNDLSYSGIMGRAAYLSLEMNLPDQANEDVEAAFKSYSGYGLKAKADVLAALKQYKEAKEVIVAHIKRYPQAYGINVELIKYHLLLGEIAEAVDVTLKLKEHDFDYRYLGEALAKVKSLKEDFDLYQFLDSLLKSDEDQRLKFSRMALGFIDKEEHVLAVEMIKKYAPSKLEYDQNALFYRYDENWQKFLDAEKPIRYLVEAYVRFVEAKRAEEGMAFIKGIAGEAFIPYLMVTGYQILNDPESKPFIFRHITDKKDPASQFAALAFAGHFIKQQSQDEGTKQLIMDYFSDPEINTFYYQMGRFLLTGEGHDNVKKLAVAEKRQIALFYFTGSYYDSINDLKKANDWYQAGIFEGTYSYERNWLQRDLDEWKNQSLSLTGLLKMRIKNRTEVALPSSSQN